MKNVAFIDSQNLYKSTYNEGWVIDYRKLRLWLKNRFGIEHAFMFFGYVDNAKGLYRHLEQCGFELIFRPIEKSGRYIKGNIDVDLTIHDVDQIKSYDKAYLFTSDGDFFSLVNYLQEKGKFGAVFSPSRDGCSYLLKKAAGEQITFLDDVRQKIEK